MSTRSVIGIAFDGGFEGRYCHWDGYPTARGKDIFDTFAELGSAQAVIDYAIKSKDVEGYWSSYMTPSQVAIEAAKPDRVPCDVGNCNGTGNRTDMKLHKENWCNGCDGTGMMRNSRKTDGFRTDNGGGWTDSSEDMGAEWAYLLDGRGVTVLSFRYEDDSQGVGMFGSIGEGYWRREGFVAWTDTPDWKAIESGAEEGVLDQLINS